MTCCYFYSYVIFQGDSDLLRSYVTVGGLCGRVCCRSLCLTVMVNWRPKWRRQLRSMSIDYRLVRRLSTTLRLSLPSSWRSTNASLKTVCLMTSAMLSDRWCLGVTHGLHVLFMFVVIRSKLSVQLAADAVMSCNGMDWKEGVEWQWICSTDVLNCLLYTSYQLHN